MAIKANIIIDQGADYSTAIELTDDQESVVDLTGYTANAHIRKTYTSSNATPFTVSVNAAFGVLTLDLTANASANMVAGRYVYDVVITSNTAIKSRVVEGIVTITPRVTT